MRAQIQSEPPNPYGFAQIRSLLAQCRSFQAAQERTGVARFVGIRTRRAVLLSPISAPGQNGRIMGLSFEMITPLELPRFGSLLWPQRGAN